MNVLLGTVFLFAAIGAWYFTGERPNKQYQVISLIIALLAAVLIWFIPSSYFFFVTDNDMIEETIEKAANNIDLEGIDLNSNSSAG